MITAKRSNDLGTFRTTKKKKHSTVGGRKESYPHENFGASDSNRTDGHAHFVRSGIEKVQKVLH